MGYILSVKLWLGYMRKYAGIKTKKYRVDKYDVPDNVKASPHGNFNSSNSNLYSCCHAERPCKGP